MVPEQKVKVRWVGYTKQYYIDLGYQYTKINDEFEVDIKDLPLKSNMYVKFICDYCNGENQKEEKDKCAKYCNLINARKRIKKDCCTHCKGKKLSESLRSKSIPKGESLAEKFPDIAKEWIYEKNERTPWDYLCGSNCELIWWECENGHEWQSTIFDRTYETQRVKCPYCTGRIVTEENCLATTHPEIARKWHPTKNGDFTPYDCVYHSSKRVWWLDDCGHEYSQIISPIVRGIYGCPYCSGEKVCIDNCLATVNPELSKEWHTTKNGSLTPYDFTSMSTVKVWWQCNQCGHEWKTNISGRSCGNKCPACKETTGEKQIRNLLKLNNIKFEIQQSFEGLIGVGGGLLKFDFNIIKENKLILIIEYDGEFHFMKLYKKDNHETTVIHDILKNKYCRENNITLIRIPFWEMDNIELIINNVLGYFNLIEYNYDESIVNKHLINHHSWTEEKYQQEFKDNNKYIVCGC